MVSKLEFFGSFGSSAANNPKRSGWIETVFCGSLDLLRNLLISVLNSSSSKIFRKPTSSGFSIFIFSMSNSTGTSVLMVARKYDILISSIAASTFSRSLPFILSVFSSKFATEPNSFISLTAVFSPTPGHPGKLSAESPMSARRSITWEVFSISYFSHTPFSSSVS